MRTVDNTALSRSLASGRIIGSRLTFRDTRLIFSDVTCSTSVTIGGVSYNVYADVNATFTAKQFSSGGILRICGIKTTTGEAKHLVYHYQADPSAAWTGTWVDIGVDSVDGSMPGLYVEANYGYLFYHDTTNRNIRRIRFNPATLTWDNDAQVFDYQGQLNPTLTAIMPVSSTVFYANMRFRRGSSSPYQQEYPFSEIGYVDTAVTSTYGSLATAEDCGLSYLFLQPDPVTEIPPAQYNFDNITYNGMDYLFYPEYDSRRAMYITVKNKIASNIQSIIPLDVVDNDVFFKLGGVTLINGKLCATGVLSRTYGGSMHVYSFGPDHWSFSRDMFICLPTEDEKNMRCPGGKMFSYNNKLYYVRLCGVSVADSTLLVGYDHASKKFQVTSEIALANISERSNGFYSMTVSLKSDTQVPGYIGAGSRADFELLYGEYVTGVLQTSAVPYNVFELGTNINKVFPTGKTIDASLSSFASKRIGQWNPDCAYDYWSQTKQSNPLSIIGATANALSGLVRGSGIWFGDETKVKIGSLNTEGILFSAERASRGCLARARFTMPTLPVGVTATSVGLIFNYWRETKAEAATRLGKTASEIRDTDYGHHYFNLLLRSDSNYIKIGRNNAGEMNYWDPTTSVAQTTNPFWMMATYHDGIFRIYYRLDSAVDWTYIDYPDIGDIFVSPWPHEDYVGRGGISMSVGTGNGIFYGCSLSDRFIQLSTIEDVEPGLVLGVGEEHMTVVNIVGRETVHNLGVGVLNTTTVQPSQPTLLGTYRDIFQGPGQEPSDPGIYQFHNTCATVNIHGLGSLVYYFRPDKNYILQQVQFRGFVVDSNIAKTALNSYYKIGVQIYKITPAQTYMWLPGGSGDQASYNTQYPGTFPEQEFYCPLSGTHALRGESHMNNADYSRVSYNVVANGFVVGKDVSIPKIVGASTWNQASANTNLPWILLDLSSDLKQLEAGATYAMVFTPYRLYFQGGQSDTEGQADTFIYRGTVANTIMFSEANNYINHDCHLSVVVVGGNNQPTDWYAYLNYLSSFNQGSQSTLNANRKGIDVKLVYTELMPGADFKIYLNETWTDPTVYIGETIVVTDGKGKGQKARIVAYRGLANANTSVFSIDTDIGSLLDSTSVVSICPTVEVNRGVDDTTAVTHAFGEAFSVYTDYSPEADIFEYFSNETDMRLEDMIAEIAGKAGVEVTCENALAYTSDTKTEAYKTAMEAPITVNTTGHWFSGQRVFKQNHIVKLWASALASGSAFGLSIHGDGVESLIFRLLNDSGTYKIQYLRQTGTTTFTLRESLPLPLPLPSNAELVFSVQENIVSVWLCGRSVMSFVLRDALGSPVDNALEGYARLYAYNANGLSINIDWSELDDRVDNFILDMGVSGLSLLSELLKEKRVFFQDSQDGKLRCFRNRTKINTDIAPYLNGVAISSQITDSNIASRIMLDGIDIVESLNVDLLREYGNVFYYGNSERLDTRKEMEVEIENIFSDMIGKMRARSIAGALDPRIEPNDIVYAQIVDSSGNTNVEQMVIDEISIGITGGNAPAIDMEATGYENA